MTLGHGMTPVLAATPATPLERETDRDPLIAMRLIVMRCPQIQCYLQRVAMYWYTF